jgi:hypothetical protein
MHESGQRTFNFPVILPPHGDLSLSITELNQLTGIAAILTFPLDVEIVEMEEREAKEESGRIQDEQGDADEQIGP